MRTERRDSEDGSYSVAAFDDEGRIVPITEYDANGLRLREHYAEVADEPRRSPPAGCR